MQEYTDLNVQTLFGPCKFRDSTSTNNFSAVCHSKGFDMQPDRGQGYPSSNLARNNPQERLNSFTSFAGENYRVERTVNDPFKQSSILL